MHKLIVAIIRHERLEKVISALTNENIGFAYAAVKGF
jgi:nitrogen regulatory protein PII